MSGRFPSDDDLEQGLRNLSGRGLSASRWDPSAAQALGSVSGSVVLDSSEHDLEAVRSSAVAEHRQLVIEAGGAIVVLDVMPAADPSERVVRGQVTSLGPTACAIQFVDIAGHELALALADELGEFDVVVPTGRLTMFVATDAFDAAVDLDLD